MFNSENKGGIWWMKRYFLIVGCIFFSIYAGLFAAEVKIGVCLPFTGEGRVNAEKTWDGIRLANELMPSVGNYKIVLIKGDDRTNPERSQEVTSLLIDEGAAVLIGYPWSSLAIAAALVAENTQVPLLSTYSTNPLTTKDKNYISRVCFIDPFQGKVAANFAIKTLKVKNAVLIVDRSEPYCTGLATHFKEAFSELKGKILALLYFKRGDTESTLKDIAQQAAASNPDMIYLSAYYKGLGILVKELRKLGYKGALVSGDTGGNNDVFKYAGDSVDGLYFTDHFNVDAAETKSAKYFVIEFEKKYNDVPPTSSALGWDAYLVVYNAVKSCVSAGKKPTPENINYYIRHTKNLEGATGNITINPQTGNPVKPAVVNVWKDEKVKLYTVINP